MGKKLEKLLGTVGKVGGEFAKESVPIPILSDYYGDLGEWGGKKLGGMFKHGGVAIKPTHRMAIRPGHNRLIMD